MIQQGIFFKDQ